MGLKCGIVGLPNVGKSTLFNALTSSVAAEAANYPFCTIEPNLGKVAVPDNRLNELAAIAGSKKIIPTQIEFVDIAGLVRGASKGEGLGNQFLGHIREVDAIIYVLRCFEDGNITHVEGKIDPIHDAAIIETELMLADIQSLTKRLQGLEKKAKQDKTTIKQIELINSILELLDKGIAAKKIITQDNAREVDLLQLLTSKPILYVCNVSENDILQGNQLTNKVQDMAKLNHADSILISAKIEQDIANLTNVQEKQEFLTSMGLEGSGLTRLIRSGYEILQLITFFTLGPKEAHAWTVVKGTSAPLAAGEIHSDFTRGFICAEIINYKDYVQYKSEAGAKEAGKMRLEGKDYIIQDGDIVHFKFNV